MNATTTTSSALMDCLADLLSTVDADHERIAAALAGRPSSLPTDEAMAALHRTIVVARALDPGSSALDVLAAATEAHPVEVQEHLTWLSGRAVPVVELPQDTFFSVAC